jgi:2-octaprenyl-6-methoxyphenol hydroxylase
VKDARIDAIVVGAGPAGLVAACLLANSPCRVALVADVEPRIADTRTVALMMPSIRLLENLALWPGALQANAAPLRRLRMVDDSGSPVAAPELLFSADEINETAFGWNVPLANLTNCLREKVAASGVTIHQSHAETATLTNDSIGVRLSDGTELSAGVVFAADGHSSNMRAAAGIAVSEWSYDQTALALSFAHSAPHHDTSTEYHKLAGPFTTVPLPGRRSSLVWMERPRRVLELLELNDRALAAEIQIAGHGDLGRISAIGPRAAFPMRGLRASMLARHRVILLGEAGHVVPPVGAQGLNMSIRDAAVASELVIGALATGEDPGSVPVLSEYDRRRRADVMSRQAVIDGMNRSLLSGLLPLAVGRVATLTALKAFGPLRHYAMSAGLGIDDDLPLVMRQ